MGWEKYRENEIPEIGDIVTVEGLQNEPFGACIISFEEKFESGIFYTLERPHVFMTQCCRYPAVMCENMSMLRKSSLLVWREGNKINNRLRGY